MALFLKKSKRMKRAVLNLMRITGAFAPFRLVNRNRALILTYHRFRRVDERDAISSEAFEAQLEYLAARYHFVPLSLISDHLARGLDPPARSVAITIDDGYHDAYNIAFPLLRRYRIPATIFVVTDFIDRKAWLWTDKLRFATLQAAGGSYDVKVQNWTLWFRLRDRRSRLDAAARVNTILKSLPGHLVPGIIDQIAARLGVQLPELPTEEWSPVSWDNIREMEAAGVESASQTVTNPILTNISNEELERELHHSRMRLESVLARPVDLFCYPNGNYDARVKRAVARAGYRCAVTCDPGLVDNRSEAFALLRVHADRDLARFIQGTSGFEQWKRRIWGPGLEPADRIAARG